MQWPFRGHQPKMRPDGVRPGGPKRREYLDDFKRGEDGEYHYDGAYISYTGALPRKQFLRHMWAATGGAAALLLAAGCMPGQTAGQPFYAALPLVAALILAGVNVYTLARMTKAGDPMRLYLCEQTVCRLPGLEIAAAILAGLGTVGHIVWLLQGESRFTVWSALYLAAVALAAAGFGVSFAQMRQAQFDTE